MSGHASTLTGTILDAVARASGRSAGARKLLIAFNPAARRLATARERRRLTEELRPALAWNPAAFTLLSSHYPGELRTLVAGALSEARARGEAVLIASCGGDGTHREVLESAEEWLASGGSPAGAFGAGAAGAGGPASDLVGQGGPASAAEVAVIRWPFGTGNDGADAVRPGELIERIAAGLDFGAVPAVSLRWGTGKSTRAYNIASLGVDALITDLTNRLRHLVPGNIYKRIADVSVLFYEQLIGVGRSVIEVRAGGARPVRLEGRFMLIAFGAGGWRTYGNQMRVLPDERNLCAIERGHIGKKVMLKRRFYAGRHTEDRKTRMVRAGRATILYRRRIPAQCDGEAFWLKGQDFPLLLSLEEGSVFTPVLTQPGKR